MKLTGRTTIPHEPYIGSMADITFLLVVFFLVTSVLVSGRGVDLALPPPEDGPVELDASVDVHVVASGALVVDGRAMPLAELLPYLRPRLTAAPDKPVILRADPDAPYGSLMTVLDELRQAPERQGFEIANLAIPTLREQGLYW